MLVRTNRPPPIGHHQQILISFLHSTAKVFELCLSEIEKQSPSCKAEPPASKCLLM